MGKNSRTISFYRHQPESITAGEWTLPLTEFFHEMKNILAVLQGNLELLAEDSKYEADRPRLAQMLRETERLGRMAREGGVRPAWGRVELGEILEEACRMLKVAAERQGVRLITEQTPGPPVYGSIFLLRQLALNLIKNSLEAMPGGGVIRVRAATAEDGRRLLLVEDEGTGIPEEICRQLGAFGVSNKPEGNGLGLSFCRRVISQCRAEYFIQTGPRGSRVGILFPAAEGTTFPAASAAGQKYR